MFIIQTLSLPAGVTASIQLLGNTPTPVNIGDVMGPQGANYRISIAGLGSLLLADIGDSVSGAGGWAVQINQQVNWFYDGQGQMNITVDAAGSVIIAGGSGQVTTQLLPESGADLSNLSGPNYGYDMVVGTTQAAINATMKQWLDSFSGTTFVQCYVYQADVPGDRSHYVATDFEALKARVGFDPFDVPDDTPLNDPRLVALQGQFFAFAFKTTMGLPTAFPLDALPDIIVLNKGNSSVTYNLYCKAFELLALEPGGYGGGSWKNLTQSASPVPWVSTFNVSLDLYSNASAFNSLPPEVQRQVKNLCPGTMFSVQQLYLDLNTAGLESAPAISGLDPSSDAYIYLTRIFLGLYIKNMQQGNISDSNPLGNYLLGYSLKPDAPVNNSSIIPTDLNFMISPYLDGQGIATQQYDLYTLNWLVMTDTHKMPAPVPFTWNWVSPAESSQFNGVMSIKKGTFATFLNALFSPSLRSICLIPSADISINAIRIEVSYGFQQDTSAHAYNVVNDGSAKILTLSYSKNASDSDQFLWNWGNISITTSVQSDVYLQGDIISVVTTTTCYVHLNVEGGVSKGNLVQYTMNASYTIGVDGFGALTVVANPPAFNDTSSFDISGWAKFVSLGTIDDMISDIKTFWSVMHSFLSSEQQQILNMLNGSSTWVFPGGQTFAFSNAHFSNFQDLVADVSYVEPSRSVLFSLNR